ncbi:MAG: basic amino acid ABC transporter substrate-binding protein [Conchiformibius sp.]|nr:basic amino acid ABC transporter substrate-binding protein [Conchiformibius sp.]
MTVKHFLAAGVSCAALMLAACNGGSSAPAASSAGADNAATQPAGGKSFRVGMNAEFAPFEYLDENKNIHGFDVDLLKAMAEAGGFELKFEHKPWDSLFPSLGNGDLDIVASAVTITDDRKKTLDFSEPYYQIKQVVLVPAGKNVKSVEDLKKLAKVGVATGQTGDFAAQKLLGATSQNIARFESVPLLVKEVENGGVDAAISDSAVIAHYIKNNPDKGFTMVEVPDFEIENYGFVVRKGDAEKLTLLNESLKKVRESGKYQEIANKYFAH